ncbi:helix-turn-helix domain-containing protein [Streptomyces sp. NBC_00272]|uniref:helix-turn-helix domain-containing protein n=1 Tax=Streptomyces sp. NBC_00272 TaxID=2975698 RepID=UPI003FA74911
MVTVLGDDLDATALAARAGVSARHLARLFLDQLGQTPAQFVRTARAEAAAQPHPGHELGRAHELPPRTRTTARP